LSFRQDIGGEYQITQRLACFDGAQTSSDTEVVVNLLWTVLAKQLGDEIPHHIVTTAKSV
jgi:hypothetical protein